ncbi:MAG: NUDIX hydrolase [Deinococcales bacterium]|jgi:8-oxo-dGTP pyrophosphatase MutT (NUDIX family)
MKRPANSPSDGAAHRFPVSIKAVILRDGHVILLRNERGEWELPGGKLELGEDPIECVTREVHEELGLSVRADHLLDLWPYSIADGVDVLVGTYLCTDLDPSRDARLSHEHGQLQWFDVRAIESLTMPSGYKDSIRRALDDGTP